MGFPTTWFGLEEDGFPARVQVAKDWLAKDAFGAIRIDRTDGDEEVALHSRAPNVSPVALDMIRLARAW